MERLLYVLQQITRGTWFIDPAAAESHFPLLRAVAEGRLHDFIALFNASQNVSASAEAPALPVAVHQVEARSGEVSREFYMSLDAAPAGSKSLIRVEGALMKKDYCGAPGTQSLAAHALAADQHKNISGHIFLYDTPGGTVDGTMSFADTIKGLSKPSIGFIDQMAASAGYWIGSANTELVAINQTALIGSIGTMIRLVDRSGYYEEMGIKEHVIEADKSPDKNRTHKEAMKSNYKPIKEELLNPMNEIFLNAVRENRPGISESALTGKVYLANDSLTVRLIDHIGNFEFAAARLDELVKGGGSEPLFNNVKSKTEQNTMFKTNKFPKLTALANQESADEATLNAVNEEIEANGIANFTLVADSHLEQSSQAATAQAEQIASLEAQVQTLTSQNESLTAERDQAQALAAQYGAKPGASHSEAHKPEGDKMEKSEAELAAETMDNLPHNKALDGNPLFNKKK